MFDVPKFLSYSPIYERSPDSVIYFDRLTSTSDYAKELVSSGAKSGAIVLTDFQSGGRGRGGKSWQCEPGEGLLFSLVIDPDIDPSLWYRFSLAVGVAVAVTLESVAIEKSNKLGLKWPNDVHIGGKKVAGILIEVTNGMVVIGVGMNVSGSALLDTATSLSQGDINVEREKLLAELVKAIFQWGSLCGNGYDKLVYEYQKRCVLTGKVVTMQSMGQQVIGKVLGINNDGFIVLERDGESIAYSEGHDIKVV